MKTTGERRVKYKISLYPKAIPRNAKKKKKTKERKNKKSFTRFNHIENKGRFPFDQIFRFEIPGILCDEWNSIFQFVGLTNPRSSGSKFCAKIRDQTEGSFTFVYLLWGCPTTLKLK